MPDADVWAKVAADRDKPRRKRAAGQLAGTYRTHLIDDDNARLEAILEIDDTQAWSVYFDVTKGDRTVRFYGLAAAVRCYDDPNK